MDLRILCVIIITFIALFDRPFASAAGFNSFADAFNRAINYMDVALSKFGYERCCDFNVRAHEKAESLEKALHSRVHGQPFIQEIVAERIKNHLLDENPPKPLVITFFGPPGTGKNFVSVLIAEHIYRLGMNSRFVRMFLSQHFPRDKSVDEASATLLKSLRDAISACPRSLIVVDEANMVPSATLDSLTSILKYRSNVDGVDYRKMILIFITNNEGHLIFDYTFEHEIEGGRSRERLRLRDFELMIKEEFFLKSNASGNSRRLEGLASTKLLYEDYIDLLIPFLPLRQSDVAKCAEDEMVRRGCQQRYSETQFALIKQLVIDEFVFVPDGQPSFAINGCKRIETLFDIAMKSSQAAHLPRCERGPFIAPFPVLRNDL